MLRKSLWGAIPLALSLNFLALLSHPSKVHAQGKSVGRSAGSPLVLKAAGSKFVGGRTVEFSDAEIGIFGGGPVVVDQMYVQYMIPSKPSKPAVVMIHGSTLSGKTFETTPDGRMGWFEYFARNGFPSYVVDQVGRGRSGFDQSPFNDVRSGLAARETQPNLRRGTSDIMWVRGRFGPAEGVKFDDTQFPTEAANEFAKQGVPDLEPTTASNEANYAALAELAKERRRTVLVGHSQAGRFPFETALRSPFGIAALVSIEPAGCNSSGYSAQQIKTLSQYPILIIFGDHLDAPQKYGTSWASYFHDCEAFLAKINAANGKARMLHTPDLGIRGNSHMLMMDRNNLQIADLIIDWINRQR